MPHGALLFRSKRRARSLIHKNIRTAPRQNQTQTRTVTMWPRASWLQFAKNKRAHQAIRITPPHCKRTAPAFGVGTCIPQPCGMRFTPSAHFQKDSQPAHYGGLPPMCQNRQARQANRRAAPPPLCRLQVSLVARLSASSKVCLNALGGQGFSFATTRKTTACCRLFQSLKPSAVRLKPTRQKEKAFLKRKKPRL